MNKKLYTLLFCLFVVTSSNVAQAAANQSDHSWMIGYWGGLNTTDMIFGAPMRMSIRIVDERNLELISQTYFTAQQIAQLRRMNPRNTNRVGWNTSIRRFTYTVDNARNLITFDGTSSRFCRTNRTIDLGHGSGRSAILRQETEADRERARQAQA